MLRAERRTAHGTRSCGRRAVSGTAAARGCPEAQQQMKAKKIVIGVLLAVIGLPVLLVVVVVVSVAVLDRTNGSIVSSGKPRSYLLYVPESYDRAKPTPLVDRKSTRLNSSHTVI